MKLIMFLYFIIFGYLYAKENIHSCGRPKIAIIGGGIGGTATAYFLRELFEETAILYLYEPNEIGGRLATSIIGGREYEIGGSVIHSSNKYLKAFVKKFALKMKEGCISILGLFDGYNYPVIETNWAFLTIAELVYRYGLDLYWLERLKNDINSKFIAIYKLQNSGESFESVEDLFAAVHPLLPSYFHLSIREELKKQGLSDKIINELVMAVTRCNYGQSPDIHAFVGYVSLAGADTSLWSVFGGNKRVPEVLLKDSEAIRVKAKATDIVLLDDGKFRIVAVSPDDPDVTNGKFEDYDAVVIAAPLTKDKSSLEFVDFDEEFTFPGSYQRIICTLVQGQLNSTTFNYEQVGKKVNEILTINDSLFYNTVSQLSPVDNIPAKDCGEVAQPVYKVFSPKPLNEEQLNALFSDYDEVQLTDWLAYPHYESNEDAGKFQLYPGLYYNNVIEKSASAMEMSAIAARNVALLLFKHFGRDIQAVQASKDEL